MRVEKTEHNYTALILLELIWVLFVAHYSRVPLTLLLAWRCIMFIIIALIVLGIYVIFMIIVH